MMIFKMWMISPMIFANIHMVLSPPTKERVEEVRGRLTNFEEYFSYFCRLVDFPSCYERKKKRFINCRCLKNLDYDEVQVAAGAMGELLRPLFVYCRFSSIFFCLSF